MNTAKMSARALSGYALLLGSDDEIGAAILRVSVVRRALVKWAFLAEADGRDPIIGDALVHQVFLGGIGALFAEGDIILNAAALIAMAFDLNFYAAIGFEDAGVGTQCLLGFAIERECVVLEVHGLKSHGLT